MPFKFYMHCDCDKNALNMNGKRWNHGLKNCFERTNYVELLFKNSCDQEPIKIRNSKHGIASEKYADIK